METKRKKRIATAIKLLKAEKCAAAMLIGSAIPKIKSLDQHYPYFQDSNFFYLTGSQLQGSLLLLKSDGSKTLFTRPVSKTQELWEGKVEDPKKLAKLLGTDLVFSENIRKEITCRLSGMEKLYYPVSSFSFATKTVNYIISHQPFSFTPNFSDSNIIMSQLRLYKDPDEITLIKEAIEITKGALYLVQDLISHGVYEYQIRAALEYYLKIQDAEPAFDTIVASGKSAATLHYTKCDAKLKRNDLLLIDIGAKFKGYNSDISRTYPVNSFSPLQKDLYDIVLAAQLASIKKVKHNAKIKSVYLAAVKVIAQGLKDLKVLRGSLEQIIKKKTYLPYFPHSIGHSLGLDVHDLGSLRGNPDAKLSKGMVFTIEPGIYFSKKTKNIPPLGIRIEDNVLVKEKNSLLLSKEIVK